MLRLARGVSLGVLLLVLALVLRAVDWNPLALVVAGSPGLYTPLIIALFVTGGLFLVGGGQAPATGATTHGSAGWATARDLQGLLARADEPVAPGALLVAPFDRRRRLVLPPELAGLHTLIVGPSGSGKTRGFFLPNTAAARGSFVATDPKGELWELTSGYHERAWRFAPREPEASQCFNWIPLCRDEHLARLLAAAAMQLEADTHEEQFWKLADLSLCAALFAHTARLAVPTPATAWALLGLGPSGLLAALRTSAAPSAAACAALLADLKPETRAGIILSVANKLAFLQDPAVRRVTSAELAPPDFGRLQREPTAVYWVLHEQDVALLQPLASLFFTLLLERLGRGRGAVPVTLFLDEFANLGPLPHFPTTIAVARGRGVALVLGVQSLAQLERLYGRSGAATIQTNCGTKIVLQGLEYESAERVSRLLGEQTLRQEYRSRRPEAPLVTSYSYAEHQTPRRLLTADEVRRLRRDETVVIIANYRPIRAGRWCWDAVAKTAPATALGEARALQPAPSASSSSPFESLREKLQHLDEEEDGSST
jgi:type IV secretion system protein VirD4